MEKGKENVGSSRPLVSVVVPVYNAASTVENTVNSVKRNTCADWELILVNDGSTDHSGDICRRLSESDSRIKYFEQENSGPSGARNLALDKATGRYLMFLDSDDEYHPEMIGRMAETAESHNADVVMCAIEAENASGRREVIKHFMPEGRIVEGQEAASTFLRSLLRDGAGRTPSLCNKIYSMEFIRRAGMRFEPWMRHGEDWAFNMNLFRNEAPRMYFMDDALYLYLHRDDSISRSYVKPESEHPLHSLDLMLKFDSRYSLGEEESIKARYIAETFDDLISAYAHETRRESRRLFDAFLRQERTMEILKDSAGLPLNRAHRLYASMFRLGGCGFGIFFLRQAAALRRRT